MSKRGNKHAQNRIAKSVSCVLGGGHYPSYLSSAPVGYVKCRACGVKYKAPVLWNANQSLLDQINVVTLNAVQYNVPSLGDNLFAQSPFFSSLKGDK